MIAGPTFFSSAVSNSAGWLASVTQLHMDGANNSTSFPCTAPSPKTWTAHSAAKVSTAQSKYGGASGFFTAASADYLHTPDHVDFAFGLGDFCIQHYYRPATIGAHQQIFSTGYYNTGQISTRLNTTGQFEVYFANGATYILPGSTTLSANTWYHLAFWRIGTTVRLAVDGNIEGSATWASANVTNNTGGTGTPLIGAIIVTTAALLPANGYIDDLLVQKAYSPYAGSNFTPPGVHPDS